MHNWTMIVSFPQNLKISYLHGDTISLSRLVLRPVPSVGQGDPLEGKLPAYCEQNCLHTNCVALSFGTGK